MIKNLWKQVVLICGNHHKKEVVMNLKEGPSSLFYACPKYYPENRLPEERACVNRLNLVDFERMLDHISRKIMDNMERDIAVNLTGYQFKDKKGTQYKILLHTDEEIKIEVLNRRAIK